MPSSTVQWLTTGFMLTNGIMIPVTAFLTETFTTRQLFLYGDGHVLRRLTRLRPGLQFRATARRPHHPGLRRRRAHDPAADRAVPRLSARAPRTGDEHVRHGHRLCSGTGPHHLRSAGRMAELALDVRAAGGNRRRRDRGRLLHGAQRGRADPPAYRRAVRGTFDLRFRRCALRLLHCRRKRLGQHGRAGISSHWRNRPDTVHLAPDAAGTANA